MSELCERFCPEYRKCRTVAAETIDHYQQLHELQVAILEDRGCEDLGEGYPALRQALRDVEKDVVVISGIVAVMATELDACPGPHLGWFQKFLERKKLSADQKHHPDLTDGQRVQRERNIHDRWLGDHGQCSNKPIQKAAIGLSVLSPSSWYNR